MLPLIAAALAVHNRREYSVRAIEALLAQRTADVHLKAWVYDDASTDGTGEALGAMRDVYVIPGHGQAYWSGGMHVAMTHAIASDPDFLLMLNDDVELDPDALARLLHLSDTARGAVLVGSMRSSSGFVSYGGIVSGRNWSRLRFIQPGDHPQPIDTFHGNLVLVPRSAWQVLGPVDDKFVHNYGDLDYGLRARAEGISTLLAPGTFGLCEPNDKANSHEDPALSRTERWRLMLGPKGRPWSAHKEFARRYAGRLWPLHVAATYLKFSIRTLLKR